MQIFTKPQKPKDMNNLPLVFKFVVETIAYKKMEKDFLTHNQFSSLIFGKADSTNQAYLSEVIHHYERYIDRQNKRPTLYRFNFEKIEKDFSFGDQPSKKNSQDITTKETITEELVKSIDDEIIAAKEDRKKNTFRILKYNQLESLSKKGIYELTLLIEGDDFIKIYEGMPAQIKAGKFTYSVDILEFERTDNIVTVHSDYPLQEIFQKYDCKLMIDAVWLLEAIKERLSKLSFPQNAPIKKLLESNYSKNSIEHNSLPFETGNLDEHQKNAVTHSFENDLTLIWGPPGTGKSFTLGYFLVNALARGEKTLVCCIANVAVDSITKKLVNILEELPAHKNFPYKKGKILRVGYTRDPILNQLDYLFPKSETIEDLRARVEVVTDQISKLTLEEKVLRNVLQSQRADLKKQLSQEIKKMISQATIVFCTASKMHTDSVFEDLEFSNLVVDEASMMSVPHFVVLANKIQKRLIIAGDFRQLGPVVLSRSAMAQKWLFKDLFEFSGLDHREDNMKHDCMVQLKTQRRFNEKICHVINEPFYGGELRSIVGAAQTRLVPDEPAPGRVIAYYDLGDEPEYRCQYTSKQSRFNKFSANFIINNIIEELQYHRILGVIEAIGIVTPYRAQVNELNSLIEMRNWPKNFKEKIKIGTIHSFQGSEADLLIFDLVESRDKKLGRLFMHHEGARLVNVAISRAKSKLLVVGDIQAIISGTGSNNITYPVLNIFRDLERYRFRRTK